MTIDGDFSGTFFFLRLEEPVFENYLWYTGGQLWKLKLLVALWRRCRHDMLWNTVWYFE